MREGWEYKKIKEVCSFIGDGDWIESKDQSDSGIRLIQTGNIGTGIYRDKADKVKYISNATFSQLSCTEIFEGDCLLSRLPDPIGRSCLLPKLNVRTITAVDCTILRFKDDVLPTFFVYYTQSNSYYKDILSKTTGTTRKRISRKNLEKIGIPIPPKSTQLSIVSELDKLNELIQIKKEQLKDYDALAQSIFYEMFGDPVENEKGWEVKKLGELCSKIGSGATPRGGNESYKDEGISLIRSLNVYNNEFRRKDLAYIDDEQAAALSNVTLLENDVLLNITGASVARCCIVPSDLLPARVNQHVCIIRPLDNVLVTIFLNKVLTNISYQIRLLALARNKGATREALPKSVVDSLLVPLPPLSLQHSFAHKIEQIGRQKAEVQKTITDLETLLAARMQYWFD